MRQTILGLDYSGPSTFVGGKISGAGNLWLWLPQVRFQQDFHLGEQTGLRAQAGVVQTHEVCGSPPSS